jgi:hypothetical protein
MPYRLEKEKTDMTPYVLIDEENGYMRLEGESYHDNVVEFFREISDWLSRFLETDFAFFTFDCEFRYFNSSTVKLLLNMLLDMDDSPNGKNITVNWITVKNNRIIIECGEDFQEDLKNLRFNLVMK